MYVFADVNTFQTLSTYESRTIFFISVFHSVLTFICVRCESAVLAVDKHIQIYTYTYTYCFNVLFVLSCACRIQSVPEHLCICLSVWWSLLPHKVSFSPYVYTNHSHKSLNTELTVHDFLNFFPKIINLIYDIILIW